MLNVGKFYNMKILPPGHRGRNTIEPDNHFTTILTKEAKLRFYHANTTFILIEENETHCVLLMPDGFVVECFSSKNRYIQQKNNK